MIKLSRLRDEVLVDKTKYYQLKGANDLLVNTIGSVTLDVQMGSEKESSQFQVLQDNFPVPHDGVLGNSFIEDNELNLNYYLKKVIYFKSKPLQVAPRTETIIPIFMTIQRAPLWSFIHSQFKEILYNFTIWECISYSSIRTTNDNSNQPYRASGHFSTTSIGKHIFWAFQWSSSHGLWKLATRKRKSGSFSKNQGNSQSNSEERDNLWKIFWELSTVFHLEGDQFLETLAIEHEIHFKENAAPVNISVLYTAKCTKNLVFQVTRGTFGLIFRNNLRVNIIRYNFQFCCKQSIYRILHTFIIIIKYTQLQFQTKINRIFFFLNKYSVVIIGLRLLKNIKNHWVSKNTLLRFSRPTVGYEFFIYWKNKF